MKLNTLLMTSTLTILSAFVTPFPKGAMAAGAYSSEKVADCKALKDEETYKKNSGFKYLVVGKDGVLFRTDTDLSMLDPVSQERKKYYKALSVIMKEKNIALINLLLPPRGSLFRDEIVPILDIPHDEIYTPEKNFETYKTILSDIREQGIYVVPFDDLEKNNNFYYKQDHHWSPEGAQEGAKRTTELIKAMPQFKDIPGAKFTTKNDKKVDRISSFSSFVSEKCHMQPGTEKVDIYKTILAENKEDEQSLFGDDNNKPYIALVGTSNSIDDFPSNFAGWLRQDLQADVRNFSLSGTGPETILAFTNSDEFKKNPPKIILWESYPSYNNNAFESILKQLLPSFYETCTANDSLFSKKINLKENLAKEGTMIFEEDKILPPVGAYVVLDFSSPPSSEISFNLTYKGKSEKIKISQKAGKDKQSSFKFAVGRYSLSDLSTIELKTPQLDKDITLNYRFCEFPKNIQDIITSDSNIKGTESTSKPTGKNFITNIKNFLGEK